MKIVISENTDCCVFIVKMQNEKTGSYIFVRWFYYAHEHKGKKYQTRSMEINRDMAKEQAEEFKECFEVLLNSNFKIEDKQP